MCSQYRAYTRFNNQNILARILILEKSAVDEKEKKNISMESSDRVRIHRFNKAHKFSFILNIFTFECESEVLNQTMFKFTWRLHFSGDDSMEIRFLSRKKFKHTCDA